MRTAAAQLRDGWAPFAMDPTALMVMDLGYKLPRYC